MTKATQALAVREPAPPPADYQQEEIQLIKDTVAKGVSDSELRLFLHLVNRTGLDPLARQIHAVKRFDGRLGREVMTVQTGIDGYRLIADRTGEYLPGRDTELTFDEGGQLVSATAFVRRFRHGEWHEIAATAHWAEFAQTNKNGQPAAMWARMPRLMLGKCAEALALRKAFPAELSGLYTREEMSQGETQAPSEFRQAVERAQPPAAGATNSRVGVVLKLCRQLDELGEMLDIKNRQGEGQQLPFTGETLETMLRAKRKGLKNLADATDEELAKAEQFLRDKLAAAGERHERAVALAALDAALTEAEMTLDDWWAQEAANYDGRALADLTAEELEAAATAFGAPEGEI
jgi:phage recombination protein Bet